MDPNLRDLLRTVATNVTSGDYTHETYFGPRARWNVDAMARNTFWSRYCALVSQPRYDNTRLSLAEKAEDYMPLIVKFNFRFYDPADNDETWEPYTDHFLKYIINIYQNLITKYFIYDDPNNTIELLVVILENPLWHDEVTDPNGQVKRYANVDLRLQFPFAIINSKIQRTRLRDEAIDNLRTRNVMSLLSRQPIGDWEQIIPATTDALCMYGSTESLERPPLGFTDIWGLIRNEEIDQDVTNSINMEDFFFMGNHRDAHQNDLKADLQHTVSDVKHWLPILLSIGYWSHKMEQRPELLQQRGVPQMNLRSPAASLMHSNTPSGMKYAPDDDAPLDFAETFLVMLQPDRYTNMSCWLDIGRALYTEDMGGSNGLKAWIRHTHNALATLGVEEIPDFMLRHGPIESTCHEIYNTFYNNAISVKTLAWFAREDNATLYKEWHYTWIQNSISQALSIYHTDVANAFYRVYWLDYVFAPGGKGVWYRYYDNRWNELPDGLDVRKELSHGFLRHFSEARAKLAARIHESTNEDFKTRGENLLKKMTLLIGKLKTVGFKRSILTECTEFFIHDRFDSLLDTFPQLTGVKNGVIEIHGKGRNSIPVFRSGKPEDYISMCTNVPYEEDYSFDHPTVIKLFQWFHKVFPDPDLRHYFLKIAATGLYGKNSDKIFGVFTGGGDNSKSMIVKLFETTFGSYVMKMQIAVLTEKNGSASGPSPHIARAKNRRWVFVDEPDDDINMSKGIIKRYTGGDSFFARKLHENGADIVATFTLILMCNNIPVIANPDKAVQNRTLILPYLSKWSKDDYPEDEEEQMRQRKFKMDPLFEEQIPYMASAFFWVLCQYYQYYAVEGLLPPNIVKEHTTQYWKDNDLYANFIDDVLELVTTSEAQSCFVSLVDIYNEFKLWFRDSFPGQKEIPARGTVRTALTMRLGKMRDGGWYGLRIRQVEGVSTMGMKAPFSKTDTRNSEAVPMGPIKVVKKKKAETQNTEEPKSEAQKYDGNSQPEMVVPLTVM